MDYSYTLFYPELLLSQLPRRPGGSPHLSEPLIDFVLSGDHRVASLPNPQQSVLNLACVEIMIKLISPEIE